MRSAVFVVLLLVGCAADGVDPDGDADAEGGSCTEAVDTCTADTICVSNACVSAFDRTYTIRDVVVHVPVNDLSGDPWDLGNGAPDLKLDILVNGIVVAASPSVSDQFTTTFAGPYEVTLAPGSTLLIAAVDEDPTGYDEAMGCKAAPLTADHLRARSLVCSGSAGSLSYQIDPR